MRIFRTIGAYVVEEVDLFHLIMAKSRFFRKKVEFFHLLLTEGR